MFLGGIKKPANALSGLLLAAGLAGFLFFANPADAAIIYQQTDESGGAFSVVNNGSFYGDAGGFVSASTAVASIAVRAWTAEQPSYPAKALFNPGNASSSDWVALPSSDDSNWYCLTNVTPAIAANTITQISLASQYGSGAKVGTVRSSTDLIATWGTRDYSGTPSANDWVFRLYDSTDCDGDPGVGDPVPDPAVLIPLEGATVAQATINAVGSSAYSFMVTSGIDPDIWPDLSVRYQLQVFDDSSVPAVVCLMDNLGYTASMADGLTYSTTLQHKVDGQPDPCPNFDQGAYTANTRVFIEGGSGWSDWSDSVGFTIGETDFDPVVDCPDDPSFLSLCYWQRLIMGLFWPSDGATSNLWSATQELGQVWPLCYITNSIGAVADAFDQDASDLGTPDAGNIVNGDWPNLAWVIQKAKTFWGDWAAIGMAIMIWLTAIRVVLGDILGVFGLSLSQDEEAQ